MDTGSSQIPASSHRRWSQGMDAATGKCVAACWRAVLQGCLIAEVQDTARRTDKVYRPAYRSAGLPLLRRGGTAERGGCQTLEAGANLLSFGRGEARVSQDFPVATVLYQ